MTLPLSAFAARRDDFLARIGNGVGLFPAAPVFIRNNDVEHAYRPDSDLFYLSGFPEPGSLLLLTNQHPEHRSVLFVPPRDPEREIWDGPRAGVEGALRDYGVDAAYPLDRIAAVLPDYLQDVDRVHYRVGHGHPFDATFFDALAVVRRRARKGVRAPSEIVDIAPSVHEMRLRKGPEEIDAMRRALAITGEAHRRAMAFARPGLHEYEVEAEMVHIFRRHGSLRAAYDSIVGSGPNATILHYRCGERRLQDGELLLIDAGCELDGYASDVTRTFPVSGVFSGPQRALYEICLRAEEKAIATVRPGSTLDEAHAAAARVVTQGLIDEGLLEGPLETALEKETFKAFFMHKTSHWIGMDVHDVGAYFHEGAARPLEPGMALTVEPGIYVGPQADVDERWRGIGIRIEDDVLVTAQGHDVLSADIPKSVADVEAATKA